MHTTLSALHLYPLKSCAAVSPDCASVERRGLRHDRRWMAVDAKLRFLTGRQLPRLTLVRALPMDNGLTLSAPAMPDLFVPMPLHDAPRAHVDVWTNKVNALITTDAADRWLSDYLGQVARLVYMDESARRPVDPDYADAADEVSFADGFPLLLIGQASLDALNERLAAPVPMLRFRPNLVIDAAQAHAEDTWRRIRIGALELDVVKSCTRCVFTTVDPALGALDPSGEPLRSLIQYRRGENGVTFGQNLIPRGSGMLRIGDPVQVLV